jgi:hypothetical protein
MRYAGPRIQTAETLLLLQLKIVLTNFTVPANNGLQKKANFSTLIAGLDRTGD